MMGASDPVLPFLSGMAHNNLCSGQNLMSSYQISPLKPHFRHKSRSKKIHFSKRLKFYHCKCQQGADSNSRDLNPTWIEESINKTGERLGKMNTNGVSYDDLHIKTGKEDFKDQNDKLGSSGVKKSKTNNAQLIEEEAWQYLRESVVNYCGSPVGTIAANDPSDACVLNYDQVFIRDFIPSGIAFLLNGEYEIVRNFILHTLQLQVRNLL